MITKEFAGLGSVPLASFTLSGNQVGVDSEFGRIEYWVDGVSGSDQFTHSGSVVFAAGLIDGSSTFDITPAGVAENDPFGIQTSLTGSLALHVLTFSLTLDGAATGVSGTVGYEVTLYRDHEVTLL